MNLKTFEDMQKTSAFFMLKPANAIYGFVITIFVSIVVILVWAIFAPMDDVVKASVLLRPAEAVSSIKCVTSGELSEKYFENDDLVNEGDLLFSLDTASYKSQLETYKSEIIKNQNEIFVNNQLLQTLEANKMPDLVGESETAQVSDAKTVFVANAEPAQVDAEVNSSDAFIKCSAYLTEFQRYQTGISDLQTKLNREKSKPQSLKVPQTIQDLETELNQNQLAFESWKNSQKLTAIENQKNLESAKKSLESRIAEIERLIKNSTIYAPISGRISEITKLNPGDYLLAGEEILRIVPQNSESLKADIYVDPSYIARVKNGNPVKIKFPGLPPSRYGMVESQVAIVPPDVSYVNGQPVFIAEAEIKNPYLTTKNGQTAKLIPGITAEGRIVTDRSTVMQMVLRKLDFMN